MSFLEVSAVPAPVRIAAESMAQFVCADLGIAPAECVWFESACRGVRGAYVGFPGGRGALSLRAGMTARVTVRTVAHELRHAWQSQTGRLRGFAGRDLEKDAREYAAAAVRRWRSTSAR